MKGTNQENPVFREERLTSILEALRREGTVYVKDLTDEFGVSSVTIRQDLNHLEQEGLLVRTHGGAIRKDHTTQDSPYAERINKRFFQKAVIAHEALQMIDDHDSLLLDGGTTLFELAKSIAGQDYTKLTIVFNFLPFISVFANKKVIDAVLLGGSYEDLIKSITGLIASSNLQELYLDKAFISTTGFSLTGGLTCTSFSEAHIRRSMLSRSRKRILLADSSKFDRSSFVHVAPLTEIDTIITDWELTMEAKEQLEETGISVIIAQPSEKKHP